MTASAVDALVAAEQRVLRASIWIALVMAVISIVLGLVAGTRVLVFDGVFSLTGLIVSGLTLRASRLAGEGPTERYPFGRDGLAPFMVLVQGVVMAGALVYAAADAVIIILQGGRHVAALVVVVYAGITGIACLVAVAWMRRVGRGSDLADAEALQWRSSGILSLVMAAGALVAVILAAVGVGRVLDFVDPVLVLLACALVTPSAIGMLRHGFNELIEGRPARRTRVVVDDTIAEVTSRFALPAPLVRSTKLGAKLYVDVVYLVDDATMTIRREDEIRRAVHEGLADLPLDLWVTVEVTADPALAD